MTEPQDWTMYGYNKGFTLIEIIGVLAVIAIIAAVATPQIFQAIQDSKITSAVQSANQLKSAVARYYTDTGQWPRHIPSHADPQYHQLMTNSTNVNGWNGPYLEAELTNELSAGGYLDVFVSNHAYYACDLDGDGTGDGSFIIYRMDGVDNNTAKKISSMLDKDGAITAGTKSWEKAGRVKLYRGLPTSTILVMCLARV